MAVEPGRRTGDLRKRGNDGLMAQDSPFDAVLTLACSLDHGPAEASASLAAIDRVLQDDAGAEGDPGNVAGHPFQTRRARQ